MNAMKPGARILFVCSSFDRRSDMESGGSPSESSTESASPSTSTSSSAPRMSRRTKALFSKGRYSNPWDTYEDRNFVHVAKWMLNRQRSKFPTLEELEKELPVVEPDWKAIWNPGQKGNDEAHHETSTSSNDATTTASSSSSSPSASTTTSSSPSSSDDPTPSSPSLSHVQATWIGHASFLVQMEGVNFLTDPVWNDFASPLASVRLGPKRFRPVPFPIERLPPVDFVLISHNHYDHLDIKVVEELGNRTRWYVPKGLKPWFNSAGVTNVEELEWWETAVYRKEVEVDEGGRDGKGEEGGKGEGRDTEQGKREVKVIVASTPCQHWSYRSGFDRFKSLWSSWVVVGKHDRVFFAGDTGYCTAFEEIGDEFGPITLGLIPIGAYCPRDFMKPQHVDPAEAVRIHRDIRARFSIGMHWGTFVLTDEPIFEPPRKLKEAAKEQGLADDEFVVVKHGETRSFCGRFEEREVEEMEAYWEEKLNAHEGKDKSVS